MDTLPSVFLSFSGADAELATALRIGLQDRGINVWKAPESVPAGTDWAAAIVDAIDQQEVFLLLWSDAAMASSEVTKEIARAASRNRSLLLPVLLTSAEPQGAQAYHLADTQWLDGQALSISELVDCVNIRLRDLIKGNHLIPWRRTLRSRVNLQRKVLQLTAICLALSAGTFDLNPWLAPNQWLLDQRLFWQVRWRQITTQPGPSPEPIGLSLLTKGLYEELGVQPTDKSVNQAMLARLLEVLPETSASTVGLDFILDGPGANPEGHRQLAAVIKNQKSLREILAGVCPDNAPPDTDCFKASEQRLAKLLDSAGAQTVILGLGLNTSSQAPLQLQIGLSGKSFAASLALDQPKGLMPGSSVIDWSVDWLGPERMNVINDREAVNNFEGSRLVVASDGTKGQGLDQFIDQHPVPKAVLAYSDERVPRMTALQTGVLPGGAVQAAMAQSIRSGHWIRLLPFSQVLLSGFVGWLGWRAGKFKLKRSQTLLFYAVSVVVYTLLALQVLVSSQLLIPVLLPIAMATVLFRLKRLIRPIP